MDSIESSPPPHEAEKKARSGKQPLYIRLYFHQHMTELVRLIGYRSVPVEEIKQELARLVERYGQEVMADAAEEIVEIVESTQRVARLKHSVRSIARQLLGQPPTSSAVAIPADPGTIPSLPASKHGPSSTPPDPAAVQRENNQPNPTRAEPRTNDKAQYLAAYEAHEAPLYCCDRPHLKWSGEIDDLCVACESCGYVLFARDELMPDGEPPGILLNAEEADGTAQSSSTT